MLSPFSGEASVEMLFTKATRCEKSLKYARRRGDPSCSYENIRWLVGRTGRSARSCVCFSRSARSDSSGTQPILLDKSRRIVYGAVDECEGGSPRPAFKTGPNASRCGVRNDQIPRSLKSAPAERDRFPLPLSGAPIAFTVLAFGIFTSKGRAFSAATRTSNMRTASDTEMPIAASVFAALCLVFSSTRT